MTISVIIPVYNVEKYLEKCVNSVVFQSFKDLEIILVNDGSTDGSGNICDSLSSKYSNIQVVHQKNGGVSSARNNGIKIATGDYITFVDSDDWLDEDMYSKMAGAAESNNLPAVVMCDFKAVDANSAQNIGSRLRGGYYNRQQIIDETFPTLLTTEDFDRIPIVSACTCMFKRELISRNEIIFDSYLRYSEDYLFMAEVMLKAENFFYLKDDYLYNYRQYNESRSKKYRSAWWKNLLYLNKKLTELLSECKEYDFSRQINHQLIHSALLVSGFICADGSMHKKDKIKLLGNLFSNSNLQESLQKTAFKSQKFRQKLVLHIMRCKRPELFYLYSHSVATLKTMLRAKLY